ncbi:MAG TPA: divergent polysaccharide deacetylase family protein [Thermoanaerobaculia bacterium]|nr:divergent polysaccharide deacetylase family protein [Thermoanaerobaculia bacterium]
MRGRARTGLSGLWLLFLGALLGAGALYLGIRDRSRPDREPPREERASAPAREGAEPSRPNQTTEPEEETEAAEEATRTSRTSEVAVVSAPAPAEGGRVALVIDDLGRSLADLQALQDLGVPLSYAVLPFEEQTQQVAAELRERNAEILLHLPMEPTGAEKDPGPGALRLGMTPEQLRQSTLAALQAVPGAAGVNNHMGSGLSADEPSMSTILGVLSTRGLFFLDSRTSAQSVAYRVAIRLGLPAAERQVFLDPDPSPEAIRAQFHRLLGLARTRGAAVAIGHPLPETLEVLAEEVPKARALGYEFVPVSYLLNRPDAPEEPEEPEE